MIRMIRIIFVQSCQIFQILDGIRNNNNKKWVSKGSEESKQKMSKLKNNREPNMEMMESLSEQSVHFR